MGTGNYNDSTARIYTDMGVMTCKEPYGSDASSLFNVLTGYSRPPRYNRFVTAPIDMRPFFREMIEGEIACAAQGLPSGITAKVNSLVDPEIIELLYKASQAGVPVKLIVRGICCLIPGVPGLSEISPSIRLSASCWSTAVSSGLSAAASRESGWAVPTGCSATWTIVSSWSSRLRRS